jgi:hypothetical protein
MLRVILFSCLHTLRFLACFLSLTMRLDRDLLKNIINNQLKKISTR